MISALTPGGDKTIGAVSVLTPSGPVNIATVSILTPNGDVALWSASGSGAFPVTIDPQPAYGAVAQQGPSTVTTQYVSATPGGGVAPHAFTWAKTAGAEPWSIIGQGTANVAFRVSGVAPYDTISATFQVTVTDARGRTAVATVDADVTNYGGLDGGLIP